MGKINMEEHCKNEFVGMLPREGKLADNIEQCIEAASYNEEKYILEADVKKLGNW